MPGIVLGALHILLNPGKQTCDKYVDSKQIDCQLFLQQKKKKEFIPDQQRIATWDLQLW